MHSQYALDLKVQTDWTLVCGFCFQKRAVSQSNPSSCERKPWSHRMGLPQGGEENLYHNLILGQQSEFLQSSLWRPVSKLFDAAPSSLTPHLLPSPESHLFLSTLSSQWFLLQSYSLLTL